jgi:hypothetical protein
MAEQPRFSYSLVSGTYSTSFVLFKKGFCTVQWFSRGVSIFEPFYISVIPSLPEFSSISFTEDMLQYATAGLYFQLAVAIYDSFGNTRSFVEKSYDLSGDIKLISNRTSDALHYNVTLCRSNAEYVLFNAALAAAYAFISGAKSTEVLDPLYQPEKLHC